MWAKPHMARWIPCTLTSLCDATTHTKQTKKWECLSIQRGHFVSLHLSWFFSEIWSVFFHMQERRNWGLTNGGNGRIMNLGDVWEQMVHCLEVKCSTEECCQWWVVGIVHSRHHLQACPVHLHNTWQKKKTYVVRDQKIWSMWVEATYLFFHLL